MKYIVLIIGLFLMVYCSSSKSNFANTNNPTNPNDTIRIANDSLEYEIIIIDAGFNSWFQSRAKPRNFYGQSYLEARNSFWVTEWNNRVMQPNLYNPNLYEMRIDYQSNINYGYEVNYMLFNYFSYFQTVNRTNLGGGFRTNY